MFSPKMTHYAGCKSSTPNFDRQEKNNSRRKPECFCLCFKITSTEFFPTPVWFYKSPQGVQNKSPTNFHHQFLNNIYNNWGYKITAKGEFSTG